MKIKLMRCGICLDWHLSIRHCASCGTHHAFVNHRMLYFNSKGIEVKRGIPMPLQRVISKFEEKGA